MQLNFNPVSSPHPSARSVTYARRGMVATSQPLAAQAGLSVMQQGGNAIDAAIATAAALTVVEPTSNGIGGDAFALVWTKDKKLHGLNSSGKSPASISIEAVKAQGHTEMPKLGFTPVTVPGIPGAWAELSTRFGKLSLAQCLAPAISYAREGYPLSPILAKYWGLAYKSYTANCKGPEYASWFETFAPDGRAPIAGEMWKSPHHASTLEEIADTGAESFYRGKLADKIAAFSKKHSGFINESDLAAFSPMWVDPISTNYRGYDVWEIPPNGQGLVALVALNMLKHFDFTHLDANTYHMQFEAIKHAFATGKAIITDPEHMQTSINDLLSDKYAQYVLDKISQSTASEPVATLPPKSGTVYLSTADGEGNMVSFIQSNYMGFGSGIVIPGTGIALQNRGADFSLDPSHANALAGSKRTYHTIIPGFLTHAGEAVGPFGVMGGYMQPQGHVQVVMNMIDFNHNPQAALDAPRWQWIEGKKFEIEHHFPRHIAQELTARGHQMSMTIDSGGFGRGQVIVRDPVTGVFAGGTEHRADGAIAAW